MPRTSSIPTLFLSCLMASAVVAFAHDSAASASGAEPEASSIRSHNEHVFGGVAKILLRTAALMPEEGYAFTPAETVRTFGEIVGHVADSQYAFCSIVRGEESPAPDVVADTASKADRIAALEEAFAYCAGAYDGLTDTAAAEMVRFQGAPTPRLGVLTVNLVHTIEHYGNLLTYLRMNDIVPPTSDPEFMRQLQDRQTTE